MVGVGLVRGCDLPSQPGPSGIALGASLHHFLCYFIK